MPFTKTLLLINIFFLQSYLIRFSLLGYPTNLQEILITVTLISFLLETFKEDTIIQKVKNIKNHWVLLGFAALTAISLSLIFFRIIPISPTFKENLHLIRHLKFLTFASILTFTFLETFEDGQRRKQAIFIAGWGAIVFGLFSIIYNLLGFNVAPDSRLLGPLDAAVYLGYYFTPFFIFFTFEFLNNPKKKTHIIYATILGTLIILTKSMGAIGGSFLVILLYLFLQKRKTILKKKSAKIALSIITIIIAVAIIYIKVLPTIQTKWSSLDERGEIWQTSAYLLQNPLNLTLGVGFGQFENQYIKNVEQVLGRTPLDYYVIQPHNIFLLFIFHYGLLGLAFLIFLIYKTVREILKAKQKIGASYTSLFIVLYFLIHGIIDTPFFKNDLLILFFIFLELGLTRSPSQKELPADQPQ